MEELYIGSIIPFAGNFPPRNCLPCDGRQLPINHYQALYSIIGNIYGMVGSIYFKIPDLRGRMPVGEGQGPGMEAFSIGEMGGYETITLQTQSMPTHWHAPNFTPTNTPQILDIPVHAGTQADSNDPTEMFWGQPDPISFKDIKVYNRFSNIAMNVNAIETNVENNGLVPGTMSIEDTGGGNSHENMSPYTVITWLIVTDGLYPSFQ